VARSAIRIGSSYANHSDYTIDSELCWSREALGAYRRNESTSHSTLLLMLTADFSDRGRLFQSDRGRCFSVIVDARGMRASEGRNVSQSSTISLKRWVAKRLAKGFGAD